MVKWIFHEIIPGFINVFLLSLSFPCFCFLFWLLLFFISHLLLPLSLYRGLVSQFFSNSFFLFRLFCLFYSSLPFLSSFLHSFIIPQKVQGHNIVLHGSIKEDRDLINLKDTSVEKLISYSSLYINLLIFHIYFIYLFIFSPKYGISKVDLISQNTFS